MDKHFEKIGEHLKGVWKETIGLVDDCIKTNQGEEVDRVEAVKEAIKNNPNITQEEIKKILEGSDQPGNDRLNAIKEKLQGHAKRFTETVKDKADISGILAGLDDIKSDFLAAKDEIQKRRAQRKSKDDAEGLAKAIWSRVSAGEKVTVDEIKEEILNYNGDK